MQLIQSNACLQIYKSGARHRQVPPAFAPHPLILFRQADGSPGAFPPPSDPRLSRCGEESTTYQCILTCHRCHWVLSAVDPTAAVLTISQFTPSVSSALITATTFSSLVLRLTQSVVQAVYLGEAYKVEEHTVGALVARASGETYSRDQHEQGEQPVFIWIPHQPLPLWNECLTAKIRNQD